MRTGDQAGTDPGVSTCISSGWTTGIGAWWPGDHTVTGGPDLVILETRQGGRIYERAPDGVEHDWGEVTVWEPPSRLEYRWHLPWGSQSSPTTRAATGCAR